MDCGAVESSLAQANRVWLLDIFNGVLCSLLIGGHLCEAVDSRDIVYGNLHKRQAIWPTDLGQSLKY